MNDIQDIIKDVNKLLEKQKLVIDAAMVSLSREEGLMRELIHALNILYKYEGRSRNSD